MKKLVIISIFGLIGCSDAHSLKNCKHVETVKTIGQCVYSKTEKYGWSECVALTEEGTRVRSSEPFVVGEKVCVD